MFLLGDEFRKHDSQRIGFLAGGASDHPDANFLTGQRLSHDFTGETFQGAEGVLVTEELGDRDQRFLGQRVEFFGMQLGIAEILRQGAGIGGNHAPLQPALDRGNLVA